MSDLKLRGIRKDFGAATVIHELDLDIQSGEFVVFVGPSGCGKSTLLRIIAGLESVSKGDILIDDEIVNDLDPSDRGIAMVFQSYALYPHMTVYKNMAFGLKIAGLPKQVIDNKVRAAADMLQLTSYLDRLPRELSGGQRQRVAIGRAITRNPQLFLFDEPLSNLDAALRSATRVEIAKLKEQLPDSTMIYVTHDQVEAMTLADRIVVLNGGRIEQIGTPLELYDRPQTLFVAKFIGSPAMNILEARSVQDGIEIQGHMLPVQLPGLIPGEAVYLGIRPEHLVISSPEEPQLSGIVSHVEHLGEQIIVYVRLADGSQVICKQVGRERVDKGDTIGLRTPTEAIHFFRSTGQRLVTALV